MCDLLPPIPADPPVATNPQDLKDPTRRRADPRTRFPLPKDVKECETRIRSEFPDKPMSYINSHYIGQNVTPNIVKLTEKQSVAYDTIRQLCQSPRMKPDYEVFLNTAHYIRTTTDADDALFLSDLMRACADYGNPVAERSDGL